MTAYSPNKSFQPLKSGEEFTPEFTFTVGTLPDGKWAIQALAGDFTPVDDQVYVSNKGYGSPPELAYHFAHYEKKDIVDRVNSERPAKVEPMITPEQAIKVAKEIERLQAKLGRVQPEESTAEVAASA